jgi:hypothetical protein
MAAVLMPKAAVGKQDRIAGPKNKIRRTWDVSPM